MVGDEILFYMPIVSQKEIISAPEKIFTIMNECINYLDTQAETRGVLSIKSVVWSGYISDQHTTKETGGRNYLLKTISDGDVKLDFLGPDIDTGFRIGAFSKARKLVVGASLTALINKLDTTKSVSHCLRIVSYELLKGVWSGRRYPVVWYHNEWNRPDKMFLYDERFNSELVENIISQDIAKTANIHANEKV